MRCDKCHWWRITIPPAVGECQNKQSEKSRKSTFAFDRCNFFSKRFDMPEGFEEIFGGFKKEKEK